MSQKPKSTLTLCFRDESYLAFRKTIFKHGLTSNEFFLYVAELLVLNDERIIEILQELKDIKAEKILGGEKTSYNAETLYDAIEKMLKK